jgi:NADH dehydrogenase (ubiquinone) Fe-S protein 3|uniref:NADH dehydrogenase subunit 9 n=1 Tax=Ochromonas danica TaxID=2986 RepID=Q9G920_OCHDN|nr:NADH dehydrogenase subunit 9 [Ochromonas danica]AAG18385.1 NADH dehydrogenase subunit 9 [Ochromonas danica]
MKKFPIKQLQCIVPVYQCFIHNNDEVCFIISHENLLHALKILKLHINYQYKLLTCISGIDFFSLKYRFCIAYDLLSLVNNSRVRVKIFVNEITPIESCVEIYKNANWWEREIWDMYGIYFYNHPDLRRILTDYGFEGYPLRKDFPLSGFVELRYDSIKKRVVLEPLQLAQEYRLFNYEIQW